MSSLARTLDIARLQPLLQELAAEARAHRFEVAPNPCVGAAVLAGSRVVARGYHRIWGGPHAEVDALNAAAASGVPAESWDTLVVTLEPCSTSAKTGACTDAILAAGIRTVVVGALDPDSRHQGAGLEVLRDAGIEVALLEGVTRLDDVAPHFLRWTSYERLRRPRPWMIAKWAQTLTGQLSPPADVGEGRWISGPAAQADVQLLRGRVDAIVTGADTILADDPRLTVRAPGDVANPPARVILDSFLRTRPDARLLAPVAESDAAKEAGGPVHFLCLPGSDTNRMRSLVEAGAAIHGLRGDNRKHLNLREVQSWLWDQGFRRVLLESGPTLLAAYLEAGFIDQVRIVTGSVRGGRGESLAAWFSDAKLLEREDRECEPDSVLEAFLAPK